MGEPEKNGKEDEDLREMGIPFYEDPIYENIEFLIAKKTIECKLLLYEHPNHKNEVVLEWRIDPSWKPSFVRISKLAIPKLIKKLEKMKDNL